MEDGRSIVNPSSIVHCSPPPNVSLASCETKIKAEESSEWSEIYGPEVVETKYRKRMGRGELAGILSALYPFQFAGDPGALERQRGMIRQQLLEKLYRTLIRRINFNSFD
jgi:hypothetical protein